MVVWWRTQYEMTDSNWRGDSCKTESPHENEWHISKSAQQAGRGRDGERDLGKDLGKEHPWTGQTGWGLIGSCLGLTKLVKCGMIVTFLLL